MHSREIRSAATIVCLSLASAVFPGCGEKDEVLPLRQKDSSLSSTQPRSEVTPGVHIGEGPDFFTTFREAHPGIEVEDSACDPHVRMGKPGRMVILTKADAEQTSATSEPGREVGPKVYLGASTTEAPDFLKSFAEAHPGLKVVGIARDRQVRSCNPGRVVILAEDTN